MLKSKFPHSQTGSAVIVSLILVASAMLAVQAILSLSEANTATIQTQLIAQSSANAGAKAWGKQWIVSTKQCIKDEILDQLSDTGTPEFEQCRADGLAACAESDFTSCSTVDLNSCWSDPTTSPLQTCQTDSIVLQESEEAGQEATRNIATKYGSQYQVKNLSVDAEGTQLSIWQEFKSQLPTFNQSKNIQRGAESLVVITKK